ncbi:MAG: PASTA domain-containing protein [Erysipelotrichia bacterium]|nr:PASTA domain-containing protein [Erysipelotrichia bacterium]
MKHAMQQRSLRALTLLALATGLLGIFSMRLVQLQIFQYNRWEQRSTRNHVSKRVLDMRRGSIVDRNGSELAISVDTYSVFIYSRELKSLPEAANAIASVLPMTREEVIAKVGDRSGYIPLYKELEPNLAMKLQKLNIPGVILESHYRRYYPQKSLASNLIGFTGADQNGLEGLELLFDKTLRGYPGLAAQEDISLSESGPPKMRIVTPPMGGGNITLTIDAFIQHTLESELAELVKQYDPIDATAIVMDPHNGDILGMACLPNYDLNNFSESKPENRRNRSATDFFEPGSCIKIIAVASAIENNKAGAGTRFYCRGYGEMPGRRIRCHGAHGLVDLEKAIAESCNASMMQLAQLLEPSMLYRTYKKFGFGDPTGIEVAAETNGIFKSPSRWSGFSPVSLSIGQEMAVTGLQLVQAYSAIANGGTLIRPRLVKRISSPDNDIIQNFEAEKIRTVISPDIARWLRRMLLGVIEGGTGSSAMLEDYTAGGKTSTAQKANPKGGYFNEKVVVSFLGMAPALDPKIVLLVAANEPKGDERTLFGGKVTAPYFARIADRVLKHLKVPPDRVMTASGREKQLMNMSKVTVKQEIIKLPNMLLASQAAQLEPSVASATSVEIVPDLRGKSLKGAIQLVNDHDLKAIFEGSGIVYAQQPPPGKPVPASKILRVKLSPDFKD